MANEKRLIDANEVERKLKIAISSWRCDCNSNAPVIARAMEDALQRVIHAPTIDAVEVVHGRWDDDPYAYVCNQCYKWLAVEQGTADMNYCPNCGAKMDGGAEGGK